MNYEVKSDHAVIRMSYEEVQTLKTDVVYAQMLIGESDHHHASLTFDQLEHILRALTSPSRDVWDSQAFEYSEWLDQKGYITPGDETHEELVNQFYSEVYSR